MLRRFTVKAVSEARFHVAPTSISIANTSALITRRLMQTSAARFGSSCKSLTVVPSQQPLSIELRSEDQSSDNEFPKSFLNKEIFGLLTLTLAGTLACYMMLKDYLGPREVEIIYRVGEIQKNSNYSVIVDAENYQYVGPKPAGELSGSVVQDKKTGMQYLLKGAKSKDALIKEFLISDFLAAVRPDEQPPSLIMEERHLDGNARFYTLSRMYPNSMDLSQFVSEGNVAEKLAKKPMIGFEVALASDFMFAKQADIKLANLIVIEKEHAYVVATIDHEMSGEGFHAKREFTTDIDKLISGIRDVNGSMDGENPMDLIDTEAAKEFVKIAKQFMRVENIEEFYRKIGSTNPRKFTDMVKCVDGYSGLLNHIEGHKYMAELLTISKEAQLFMYDRDSEKEEAEAVANSFKNKMKLS